MPVTRARACGAITGHACAGCAVRAERSSTYCAAPVTCPSADSWLTARPTCFTTTPLPARRASRPCPFACRFEEKLLEESSDHRPAVGGAPPVIGERRREALGRRDHAPKRGAIKGSALGLLLHRFGPLRRCRHAPIGSAKTCDTPLAVELEREGRRHGRDVVELALADLVKPLHRRKG